MFGIKYLLRYGPMISVLWPMIPVCYVGTTGGARYDYHALLHIVLRFVSENHKLLQSHLAPVGFGQMHCTHAPAKFVRCRCMWQGMAYINVFKCPHSQKSKRSMSGDRGGHATGPPRPILDPLNLRVRYCHWPST